VEHLPELGAIDIGNQVVDQRDLERPAGCERLLHRRRALAGHLPRWCTRRPGFQLGLEHNAGSSEIIDDENSPPGDLRSAAEGPVASVALTGIVNQNVEPLPGVLVDSNFTAHEVDELAANGQTEAGTPVAPGRGCVAWVNF